MRILVACECSGVVRDAFIARGHDAISCDIKESERPGPHFQGDVKRLLAKQKFDMMIAHPPCTYISRVSAVCLARDPERMQPLQDAVDFFTFLMQQPIPYICIENPYPLSVAGLPRWTQVVQPWQFGHPYLKATCLWLKGLPELQTTQSLKSEIYDPMELREWRTTIGGREVYKKQYHSASWVTQPGHFRDPATRARTFQGIADAMADQWGSLTRPYGFF